MHRIKWKKWIQSINEWYIWFSFIMNLSLNGQSDWLENGNIIAELISVERHWRVEKSLILVTQIRTLEIAVVLIYRAAF